MNKESKWNNFLKELGNIFFFWLFGVFFFTVFRISFISIYHKQMGDKVDFSEIVKVLFMGFRFDCTAISYFLIIPLISLLLLSFYNKFRIAKSIRIVHQYIYVILSSFICIITLNYFKEYNDQFNNFLFLGLYDDRKAVFHTILEDFHPIMNSIALLLIILLGILVFKYFEKKTIFYSLLSKIQSSYSKIIFIISVLGLFFIGMRGSYSKIPAIRKWSGVSVDAFLNKTVLNPYRSFKYALQDFNELNLLNGENPYCDTDQFRKYFQESRVRDIIKKNAKGDTVSKPKQIFLVVMESYDSWPLMDKYQQFGLSRNLSEIAKKGTHFTQFLPSSNSTFNSFGSVVTGVPYCGVNISQLGTINEPFVTSIFLQFKKLGYQTNFFYGGFLSWVNIGEFTRHQGVDRIFSGADAGGKSDSGAWGVEDEKLFDLVLKNTNPDVNSLNVILTSSYHAPYVVDVYKKGFPYRSTTDFPSSVKKYFDEGMTLEELGHLWYGDKCIGDFVKIAEKKYIEGLFCFTGDHYGRRFLNPRPNLYEQSSVPFIIYGNNIPKSVNTTPGSHIDILPTLIEKIAPKGFEYYSFGTSMFSENKEKGIGLDKMIIPNELYHFTDDKKINKIDLVDFKQKQVKSSSLLKEYDKIMSLSWYYTIKGDSIKIK